MRLCLLPVGVLLAAVLAGCGATVSGTPGPAPPRPGALHFPPRPRDLDIADLDPCTALTPAQLTQLGVGFYAAGEPRDGDGPYCNWIHSPDEPIEGYFVSRNTGARIENVGGPAAVTTVAGFPAVETQNALAGTDVSCIVAVGVAATQELQVNYFYNGSTVPMTRDLACRKAKTAAEMAMQTVLARSGG